MKKITLSLFFLSVLLIIPPVNAENEALFSAEINIRETLLRKIETLSESLDLALHQVTSVDLIQTLVKAKERGVKVRIVTDSKQARIKSSRVNLLIKYGISVKTLGGTEKGAMKHCFAILDGKKVMTGSYDWTGDSGKGNYEHILVIQDVDVVNSYRKEFDRLWREKRVVQ